MIASRRSLTLALVLGATLAAVLVVALGAPGSLRDREGTATGLELPVRVSLEVAGDPTTRAELGLYWLGSCCVIEALSEERPEILETLPPPEGTGRLFHLLEVGRSKIALSFEDLDETPSSGSPVLVRADVDQDLDLSDDPPVRCRRDEPCGPLWIVVRHPGGTALEAVSFQYFLHGDRSFLWYWRASALVGTVAGREIAVVDDDSNGTYDDPADLVAFDLDGDGKLDGGPEGRESWPLDNALPWGDTFLRVTDVDPVASVLTLEEVGTVDSAHQVIDVQSGSPIRGARITYHPGPISAVTDARGGAVVSRLDARPETVTVTANGYWGKVYGPDQPAGEISERIRLTPGPCRFEEMRWCGRETLRASSVTHSSIDLESGVVNRRTGAAPGTLDVGWYAGESMVLATRDGVRLAVLDADFDSLTAESLECVTFDQTRVLAGEDCTEGPIRGGVSKEGRLRAGTVLGIRTREGRMGKIRIERCGFDLELSWIAYDARTM